MDISPKFYAKSELCLVQSTEISRWLCSVDVNLIWTGQKLFKHTTIISLRSLNIVPLWPSDSLILRFPHEKSREQSNPSKLGSLLDNVLVDHFLGPSSLVLIANRLTALLLIRLWSSSNQCSRIFDYFPSWLKVNELITGDPWNCCFPSWQINGANWLEKKSSQYLLLAGG